MLRAIPVVDRTFRPAMNEALNRSDSPIPAVPNLLTHVERSPHLTENFGFAEHCRVDSAGHGKEVSGRVFIVMDIEVIGEVVDAEARMADEDVANISVGRVKTLDPGIDLGAVTCGKYDRFGHVGAAGDVVEDLHVCVLTDGQPFEHVKGNRTMI